MYTVSILYYIFPVVNAALGLAECGELGRGEGAFAALALLAAALAAFEALGASIRMNT